MLIKLLRAKIHNATVTQTEVNYHGSITIDADLIKAAGLMPNEAVTVADCENGNRFETYVIVGEAGSGVIGINGAAARLSSVGNRVIIMSFALLTPEEAAKHASTVVIVDQKNRAAETLVHRAQNRLNMRQIFFHIPGLGFPVYGYGVMLVVGLIAGMYLAQFLARRSRFDPEIFANAAILALISGVAGARLSHVLENLGQYTSPQNSFWQNLVNAINIREGGLTYYGGFLLATPTLILYAIWKKVPVRQGMDIIAPCLMVGLAFGRIGCFFNGCCYGAESNVPWAVEFPYGSDAYVTQFDQNMLKQAVPRQLIRPDNSKLLDYMDDHKLEALQEPLDPALFRELDLPGSLRRSEIVAKDPELRAAAAGLHANPVHPAEIYSTIVAFAIALFLLCYFTLPHVPGRVFAAMMMIEGVFRYLLEIVRVEPAVVGQGTKYFPSLPPQSYSMCMSFFLVIGGIILWYAFGNYAAKRAEAKIQGGQALAAQA